MCRLERASAQATAALPGRRCEGAILSQVVTPATSQPNYVMRPTWAEVSLSALRHNFRVLQQHVGAAVTVCCVVKADGYGHGALRCARALQREGAQWFGVTSPEEGIALREGRVRETVVKDAPSRWALVG